MRGHSTTSTTIKGCRSNWLSFISIGFIAFEGSCNCCSSLNIFRGRARRAGKFVG
uniref:Uncharacterized protein n=1 Tax=Rhizophora mucronata TaxID=61149 RepID=A0A2P2N0D6_RHIMU